MREEMGRGMGWIQDQVWEGTGGWPDGHENERKSATDGSKEMWGGGGAWRLEDKLETWDNRGAQESLWVTLHVTNYFEDMEPEVATSCRQAGTSLK